MYRLIPMLILLSLALPTAAYAQPAGADFASAPCMIDLAQYGAAEGRDAECGYLSVPEQHTRPDGPRIELAVMIIKSTAASPAPDPLVLLQGGPGGSTIETYAQLLFSTAASLRAYSDVVLFDQRGTRYSKPALACTEDRALLDRTLEQRLDRAASERLALEAAVACRDRLAGEGVNLAAFNSLENAADVEALRAALGYQQINLYGVSYGTLLAQHVMRDYPQALRSVLIDAVVPTSVNFVPDVARSANRAFGELFAACAAASDCAAAYPNLEATLMRLIERLNQQPARVPLTDPDTGKIYQAVFDGDTFQSTLFQLLYASEILPLLPAAIDAADHDDFTFFAQIMPLLVFDDSVSAGMYYSVVCAEDADFRAEEIQVDDLRPIFAQDARADAQQMLEVCERWGVPELGPAVDAPVASDIPTLIFSGRFDPITPPAYAAVAARALPNSTSVTFPNTGHGALNSSDCAQLIALAFWRDPTRPPDTSCSAALAPPVFATPSNTVLSSAAARLLGWLNGRDLLWPGVMAGALLFLLTLFLVWPLVWLIRLLSGRRAPRPIPARLAVLAAVLVAGLALALVVGLLVVVFGGGLSGLVNLYVGFPASARLLLVLAPLVAVLTLDMLLCAGLAWARGYWSAPERVYYSLLALAALVFSVGLGASGLLTAVLA